VAPLTLAELHGCFTQTNKRYLFNDIAILHFALFFSVNNRLSMLPFHGLSVCHVPALCSNSRIDDFFAHELHDSPCLSQIRLC